MQLNQSELLRYARHFPLFGIEGQALLKQAKVLCVGAGGLGAAILPYLCAAGVGTMGIIDNDQVASSNLHRQILFTEDDIGQSKVTCTQARLSAQNPHTEIIAYKERLTIENANRLIAAFDIIVDGSDNYPTRYLINDWCCLLKKPMVSASIFQFQGQISVFNYREGACYRCLYPEPPPAELSPNCEVGGVLGVLPGILGSLQATEVIKLITKQGQPLVDRLLHLDALTMCFREYGFKKNPNCPLCCHGELSTALFAESNKTIDNDLILEIEPLVLAAWLKDSRKQVQLLDVREPYEHSICNIGGKLLPLSQFKLSQLDANQSDPIVVYCKLGSRSLKIATLLKAHGFKQVYSLRGGMIAWIQEVDALMTMY